MFRWILPRQKENLILIIFSLFFLLIVVSFVLTLNKYINPSGYDEEDNVLILHTLDFDAAVAEFKYLFVEFCNYNETFIRIKS